MIQGYKNFIVIFATILSSCMQIFFTQSVLELHAEQTTRNIWN